MALFIKDIPGLGKSYVSLLDILHKDFHNLFTNKNKQLWSTSTIIGCRYNIDENHNLVLWNVRRYIQINYKANKCDVIIDKLSYDDYYVYIRKDDENYIDINYSMVRDILYHDIFKEITNYIEKEKNHDKIYNLR